MRRVIRVSIAFNVSFSVPGLTESSKMLKIREMEILVGQDRSGLYSISISSPRFIADLKCLYSAMSWPESAAGIEQDIERRGRKQTGECQVMTDL